MGDRVRPPARADREPTGSSRISPGVAELVATLPRLRPLSIVGRAELERLALVASGSLRRLTHLAIHGAAGEAIMLLEPALAKHRLEHLDLTGTPVRAALRDTLAKLTKVLVMPDLAAGDTSARGGAYVLHRNKPEWGRGEVVRRFDGKLEIEFPNAGTKILKADAPFLKIDD